MMADFKDFSVNVDGPIAVYVQIENLVQFAIASGRLNPGDQLPSVREMSSLLEVNANTVTKAYRDLELLGLVKTRRGVGVTVADKAVKIARDSTGPMVRQHLVDAVAECAASGMSNADIRSLVSKTLDGNVAPYQKAK
jgi:GntR family transcriptional regulator